MIKIYIDHQTNYCYSCQILMKLELYLDRFSKNTQISYFMKIRPVGAEFFPCGLTDRQVDMTKLIAAFHNFANEPKSTEILLS
jgi:hypothetical protein